MSRDTKVDAIARVPLFSDLSKRELADVARIADELDFRAGKVLCREGAVGREFFVILEGSCEVSRAGRAVDTIGDGDFFGEVSLLTSAPRNATVTATSPMRALVITDVAFRNLLKRSHSIAAKVIAAIAGRLPPQPV